MIFVENHKSDEIINFYEIDNPFYIGKLTIYKL